MSIGERCSIGSSSPRYIPFGIWSSLAGVGTHSWPCVGRRVEDAAKTSPSRGLDSFPSSVL